jgi:menaquinone-dependent protoporphyrinogen IX oxidase
MKTALIIYWSKTGNTEKVAMAMRQGLEEVNFQVTIKKPEEAEAIDYFDYDLVCVGAPSYSWHLPEPMTNFLNKKFAEYRQKGKIKPSAPRIQGKKRNSLCNLLGTTHRN